MKKMILILLLFGHLFQHLNAQGSSKSTKILEFKCEVNLELYNGQEGKISDKRGAVTVANMNDTDGDDLIDNVDPGVNNTSGKGRDEVDLMKLVIKKNESVDEFSLLIKKISGDFNLWKTPTKNNSFSLNSNGEAYLVDLPFNGGTEATLYVEALSPSTTPEDIKIQLLRYNAGSPVVCDNEKATAVWYDAKIVQLNNSADPEPGIGDLADFNDATLKDKINNVYRAVSGQRWGHGYFNKGAIPDDPSGLDKRLGGRLVMEFTVKPALADDQKLMHMDITRQKKVRTHRFDHGEQNITLRENVNMEENKFDFPEELFQNNETPNDDLNALDEDNTLKNNHIYAIDVPSTLLKLDNKIAFLVRLMNFKEFVRITPYGKLPPAVESSGGSRASDKLLWTCSYYAKMGANERLVADNTLSSYSTPVRVFGTTGNGTVNVSMTGSNPNNSYRFWVVTEAGQRKLKLRDFAMNPAEALFPSGGTASATLAGITVSITDGSTPFDDNNLWKFNTFTSQQSIKNNSIVAGNANVLINP